MELRPDFYAKHHPHPANVKIVIEVADTTLAYDWQIKLPLYAKADIREVWIVNLSESIVEIYTVLQIGIYRKVELFKAGNRLNSSGLSQS